MPHTIQQQRIKDMIEELGKLTLLTEEHKKSLADLIQSIKEPNQFHPDDVKDLLAEMKRHYEKYPEEREFIIEQIRNLAASNALATEAWVDIANDIDARADCAFNLLYQALFRDAFKPALAASCDHIFDMLATKNHKKIIVLGRILNRVKDQAHVKDAHEKNAKDADEKSDFTTLGDILGLNNSDKNYKGMLNYFKKTEEVDALNCYLEAFQHLYSSKALAQAQEEGDGSAIKKELGTYVRRKKSVEEVELAAQTGEQASANLLTLLKDNPLFQPEADSAASADPLEAPTVLEEEGIDILPPSSLASSISTEQQSADTSLEQFAMCVEDINARNTTIQQLEEKNARLEKKLLKKKDLQNNVVTGSFVLMGWGALAGAAIGMFLAGPAGAAMGAVLGAAATGTFAVMGKIIAYYKFNKPLPQIYKSSEQVKEELKNSRGILKALTNKASKEYLPGSKPCEANSEVSEIIFSLKQRLNFFKGISAAISPPAQATVREQSSIKSKR